MKKLIMSLALALAMVVTAQAGDLVTIKGNTEGRSYHKSLYEEGCNYCHPGSPKKQVTDAACVDCHGQINDIEITKHLKMPEANPHKSVHYNQGASCLACHAEHTRKAPVCSECHRTWFDKM
ncbi:c-type cytochrome [Desulfuromonas versatilis]|uniref:C-type cytochrome n=1 Tax=Desulfuromonas versatilis TaxID=2802975 RepID=A0ABM8HVI2_9BACT|nr:cytochrome c3 family protein [Desulfuromonas versatilis]BCR06014.1 c-type cytochrome [Desulfuromonas versatilis]